MPRLISTFALLWAATAAAAPSLLVERLDGPVTTAEISAFKVYIAAFSMPHDNEHNAFAYGAGGQAVEALGTMYEISGDQVFLRQMLRFTAQMLAARNDRPDGKVLWTGQRDPVWPNHEVSGGDARYSGTENGDVVEHIASADLLAIRSAGWKTDSTLQSRVRDDLRRLDQTCDGFLLRWLVTGSPPRECWPDSPLFGALGDRESKSRGREVPWNQQMMLNGGFQRLAECHELLADDPARVERYDAIVRTSCASFLARAVVRKSNGQEYYLWNYPADEIGLRHIEDTGHGNYDVLIARAALSGRYGIPPEAMVRLAHTLTQSIMKPGGGFASRVDGSGPVRPTLQPNWLYLAEFAPEIYEPIATADLKAAVTEPLTTARILWAKHQRWLRRGP